MSITIESLRSGDEEQRHHLRRQAFGGTGTFDPAEPALEHDRIVAAYEGDRLVGTVVRLPFGMYWGGVDVPCGGVAGVIVAPHVRGQDLARRMMHETFERMDADGEVLSALYPTTATLYRSVGYEFGGIRRSSSFALTDLTPDAGDEEVTWRAVDFDDPALGGLYAEGAAAHDGWLRLPPLWWGYRSFIWNEPGVNRYAYVGRRGDREVVSLVYSYTASDHGLYDIDIDLLGAVDDHAVGAALAFLARHGTTVGRIETRLPAAVLARHVPHLQHLRVRSENAWMLRLVDVAGCVAARPMPPGLSGSVAVDVVDPVRPANAGARVLTVESGLATWEPGGPGTIAVTINELGALYAGCDPRRLRLPNAGDEDRALLRAAFAANPDVIDYF